MAEKTAKIREQVIVDISSDITIEFKGRDDGEFRMLLKSSTLLLGNREFQFDGDGNYVGAGTCLCLRLLFKHKCNVHNLMPEMYKNPAGILVILFQSMIELFHIRLDQESQDTFFQLS